jgi:hypothetical protein
LESDAMTNEMPDDFEPCGVCGYDHAYEWPFAATEIIALHVTDGDVPEDFDAASIPLVKSSP